MSGKNHAQGITVEQMVDKYSNSGTIMNIRIYVTIYFDIYTSERKT